MSISFSAEELLKSLVTYLQETKRFILLTIDEIDYYVRRFKNEGIVYDLTRLNELSEKPSGIVGATFLAREKGFHELLDKADLSTLGRIFLEFKAYSSNQIRDILERRVEEAFQSGVCSDETISFIADITTNQTIKGDLRYALDLLLYSGILADNQGSVRVLPDHVRRVLGQISPSLTTEDLLGISDTEKIVLLAVVRSLNRDQPYASLIEIRDTLSFICEKFGLEPIENIEEPLQALWDRQIIDFKSLMEIGISGAPIEDLDKFLGTLIERLEAEVDYGSR